MSDFIPLARLWAKTSGRTGKTYLTGRLGTARLLIFENDRAGEGEPTHVAYIAPVDQQPQRPAAAAPSQPVGRPTPRRPAPRKPPAWPPPREADGLDWTKGDPLPFGAEEPADT